MKSKNIIIGLLVAVIVAFAIYNFVKITPIQPLGSIQDGQAYTSTSTNTGSPVRMIKFTGGTLGSVIITSATAGGVFEIRDATSTIDAASTSIATFTAGATAGTYTFDVAFVRGLSIVNTGVVASTTITYR